MKAIKQNFSYASFNAKNIKVIAGLLLALLLLLAFATLRDTDTLITHDQANMLYTENKIQKVIIDGELIRFKTAAGTYKIYKDAINKTAFFTKYPVEVREDKGYIYDLFSMLIVIGAFAFLYRLMQQSRLQQLKYTRSASKENGTQREEPVQALTSNVTFADVAGIKDVKEELEEIIDFLRAPQKYRDLDIRLPKG
ncbi:MAG TPA: hypothetical protein VLL31_06680, partial [Sulfurovum sp.]|nr:hypothetical protein [Sulfurovum sp.]